MTQSEAGTLIRGLYRGLWVARVARYAMLGILAVGVIAALLSPASEVRASWVWIATMTSAFCWAVLTILSTRQVRATNQVSIFAANGRLDLAEGQLREALRSFTIYGGAKLLACHNLAVVAHGRGEYAVAAQLCDGILTRARRTGSRAHRTTRMLLADSRLSMSQIPEARAALDGLDAGDPALSLAERLMLLPIAVRCDVMSGEYGAALAGLAGKIRLAELLESPRAALVHLMLADASLACGQQELGRWLQRRAALYHDPEDLKDRYAAPPPALQDLDAQVV